MLLRHRSESSSLSFRYSSLNFFLVGFGFALAGLLTLPGSGQAETASIESNRNYVRVSGTVVSTYPSGFILKSSDDSGNTLYVELDDFDWYDEAAMIQEGEKVTVQGVLDPSFFEKRSIEAERVHLHERGIDIFASALDEEGEEERKSWQNAKDLSPKEIKMHSQPR